MYRLFKSEYLKYIETFLELYTTKILFYKIAGQENRLIIDQNTSIAKHANVIMRFRLFAFFIITFSHRNRILVMLKSNNLSLVSVTMMCSVHIALQLNDYSGRLVISSL